MGIIEAPLECLITGLQTDNIPSGTDAIEYRVQLDGIYLFFKFPSRQNNELKSFLSEKKHILKGLILNKQWRPKGGDPSLTKNALEEILKNNSYPKTHKDKLDNLFLSLVKRQRYDGDRIDLDPAENIENLYFKNREEYMFYISTLVERGVIEYVPQSKGLGQVRVTYKGLNYAVELEESGINSDRCFIAMSFDEVMGETRAAIKNACIRTGFQPILIDEVHPSSEVTINDQIIAEIKKSRFVIADFTQQKNGVYFEAGYAAGRGLNVIYACSKEDFVKSHFDTNHFPHIRYEDIEELEQALVNKIEAWIK